MDRWMKLLGTASGTIALATAGAGASAHGTRIVGAVTAVSTDALELTVVDEITNEETSVTFTVDQRTRVARGGASLHYDGSPLKPGEARCCCRPVATTPVALQSYAVEWPRIGCVRFGRAARWR